MLPYRSAVLLLIPALLMAGCTKCVTCSIDLKQGNLHVATIDEFCGTEDDIEEEEDRLLDDEYTCISCTAYANTGPLVSGFHCGNRVFIDSINDTWRDGALGAGYQYVCDRNRDTLDVVCVLIPD